MEEKDTTAAIDREYIRKLYLQEYKDMRQFATHVLGNANLAEEAVQDAFITAMLKCEELKQSKNPVGWLYITLRHKMQHIERERLKVLKYCVELDAVSPKKSIEKDETERIDLLLSIQKIQDYDLVMEMYYEQLPLKEIAERHNLTIGACKMRIKRAKEKMRKNIR